MKFFISEEEAAACGIRVWPGYVGSFTRRRALGAFFSGTRIMKRNSEPGDLHRDGELGVVLGSIRQPESHVTTLIADLMTNELLTVQDPDLGICYFVEWDSQPRVAVGVIAEKVRRAP